MRLIVTITVVVLLGVLLTGCPKSNQLPASAPKLTINGQQLAPIAWDTPSLSICIHSPFSSVGEQEPAEPELIQRISTTPAYVWMQGQELVIEGDHELYAARYAEEGNRSLTITKAGLINPNVTSSSSKEYDWQKVNDLLLSDGFYLAISAQCQDGAYLIYQFSPGPSDAEQAAAQKELQEALKRQEEERGR